MDNNTYSIKEIMEQRFDEMAEHLKEIKVQTKLTNGRVSSLEKSRIQIWTSIAILLVVGGVIITLSVMAIDHKVQEAVETALNKRVEKVQYGE